MAFKPSFDKQTIDTIHAVQASASRPFYASVAVTDLAVEAIREALTDLQAKARDLGKELSERDLAATFDPKTLREQGRKTLADLDPKVLRDAADKAVDALSTEAKAAPAKVNKLVETNFASVTEAYDELVARGEILVKRIRDQRSTDENLKPTVPAAKAPATKKPTAKKAPAKKTAAKKAPAKKAPAKKAPAKKTAASTPAEGSTDS